MFIVADDTCDNVGGCHENAQCNALPSGAYRCQCNDGYRGNGYQCDGKEIIKLFIYARKIVYITKWKRITDKLNSRCFLLLAIEMIEFIIFPQHGICGVAANSAVKELHCQPLNPTGYSLPVLHNTTSFGDLSFLSDIDECTEVRQACHLYADCTNSAGSFSCECRAGFLGDGHNCIGWSIKEKEILGLYNGSFLTF